MKDVLYIYIPEMSADVLKGVLVLEFHEKAGSLNSVPLLAEAAGLSLCAFEHVLEDMQRIPADSPFIVDYERDSHITLNPRYFEGKTIPLKKEYKRDILGKHVKDHTVELVKSGRRKAGARTTIQETGESAVTVERITKKLGRALLEEEAYILGQCIQNYGPERVWSAFSRASGKSPIHSMKSILWNGAYGQRGKPVEAVDYDYKEY